MIALLLQTLAALACPTVATGTTEALSFDVAQVAIVRQGTRTTFSVSINPVGKAQEFALVQPVPEILAEEDIRTLGSTVFPTLDGYSAARHVADAGCNPPDYGGGGASDGGSGDGGATGGVDVEAEYLVGEYRITILSADESSALSAWLDDNGYHLPAGAESYLSEYIDGGSYFLAAKVADEAAVADGSPLSPLQISYDSEVFSIPIRLATLNSPGAQDMVIYAVTDEVDGRVGIANYPEFEVTDRCIWGAGGADFGAFYQELFNREWTKQGDAAWAVEFEGGPYSCNPCTNVNPSEADLLELGFEGDFSDHYLTRIHMRYTPMQADQDLMLYASGIEGAKVTAYADDNEANYECVDSFCDGTPTPGDKSEDGGAGDAGAADAGATDGGDSDEGEEEEKGCSQTGAGATGFAALLALMALALRRRAAGEA